MNETHLETLDKLLQTTDPNSSQYLEARRAQVLLMIATNDGQPCVLPHTPGYIWEANYSRIEAVDETSFQMIPSGTSEGEITLGLRLPVQYSLSMDLEFSQADSDSQIAFRHRVAYPEELRKRASSRRSVFFKLPAANGTSHFEADVDGSNISCRLNGVELARNETAVSASVSSRAASLGMPIWLKSYVPVKISNVTIHPAR